MALAHPSAPRAEISWSGWGDPEQSSALPDALGRLLRDALGVRPRATPPATIGDLELVAPRLAPGIVAELRTALGADQVRDDHETRARHARGKSTVDLLQLRTGGPVTAPDAVLTPGSHEEILAVLALCTAGNVAVVPFGGGTSVVGGLSPEVGAFAGLVALDTRRLNALVALDEESRLAVLEPGLRGPEAEALLAQRGYTLGHFPQSFEYATLGGFAATRSSGQASAGYGRFDDRVMALRLASPAGTLQLGRAPKSAAGPDLRQLVLGSEGTLGVITSLTVAIDPAPAQRVYEGWRLPSFGAGAAVLRRLAQDGPPATVLRLSDEAETALNLAGPPELGESDDPAPATGGCLAIVGWEGDAATVAQRHAATGGLLRAAGGEPVAGAGARWESGRYRAPYLRDALLNAGALLETLETVTFWSGLPRLYAAVTAALRESLTAQGTPPAILCHISHVYRAGASLYFTVACAQGDDPVAQWRAAKTAVSAAILAAGGSITHHHGVGADHREPYAQEIGDLGVSVLAAVKRTLDPGGILNPGILLAPAGQRNGR